MDRTASQGKPRAQQILSGARSSSRIIYAVILIAIFLAGGKMQTVYTDFTQPVADITKGKTMKTKWIMMMALAALCGPAQASFVTIGKPGNEADTTDYGGYGAVGYTYQISATEVTIAEFQAATGAGTGNENYWNDGARNLGTAAPAVYVSVYEAMKYCNWLTSANINTGLYEDKGAGVWGAKMDRATVMAGSVNYFALPTEDEWYKAAYFKTSSSGYSLYANGTDTAPVAGTAANYHWSIQQPWGAGTGIAEQNGTFDMMGNVWEWMDGSDGVFRGGSYSELEGSLLSSYSASGPPANEYNNIGFRVVAIPEPATATMLALSGLIITGYRRLRKNYGHF